MVVELHVASFGGDEIVDVGDVGYGEVLCACDVFSITVCCFGVGRGF